MGIVMIGIDLGKNSCSLAGLDERGSVVLSANSTRSWARIPRDGGHGFHGIVGAL